jgi:predicted nicotinamide N-methyase
MATQPLQKEIVFAVGDCRVVACRRAVEEEAADDGVVESCLFDDEHGLEAFTGLTVWDATWCLVALLQSDEALRQLLAAGARVIELGAGIGCVGLAAAVLGARVVLTDLSSVVADMLRPNIARNASGETPARCSLAGWDDGLSVGRGRAQAHALDWGLGLDAQPMASGADLRDCDVVLAADTVWLEGPGAAVCGLCLVAAERAAQARRAGARVLPCLPGARHLLHHLAHPSELLDELQRRAIRNCSSFVQFSIASAV